MSSQEIHAFAHGMATGTKPVPKRRAYVQATGNSIDVCARGGVYSITREMLKCFFDLSAVAAARVLGICLTVLKNMRRWMSVSRWPFELVNKGMFEMTREQIVGLRLRMIARLEAGGEEVRKYLGVLPMLKEAVRLGLGYKAISARAPTVCSLKDRVKALAVGGARAAPSATLRPVRVGSSSAMPARVVAEVFKVPVVKRRVNWVSQGTVCLSDCQAEMVAEPDIAPAAVEPAPVDTAPVEEQPEQPEQPEGPPRAPICPYAYVKDCVTPDWVEPDFPPEYIMDEVSALWPVMNDPKRIWMQELIYRSLVPNRSAPAIALRQPEPVSAAEMRFVRGFLMD